jgi:undecaprenyl-diphosphatase
VALALYVRRQPASPLDLAVTRRLQRFDHPWLARLMRAVSWFGFRPQSLILPALTVGTCWVARRRRASLLLLLAWMASLGSYLTKLVIRRPRPQHPGIRVSRARLRDTSYPSGHAVLYTAFWGLAAYLAARAAPWQCLRLGITALAAVLIVLVGPSRVYLGHHWFTDVLGSYLLGSAWLAALVSLDRCLRGCQHRGAPVTRQGDARPECAVVLVEG